MLVLFYGRRNFVIINYIVVYSTYMYTLKYVFKMKLLDIIKAIYLSFIN